MSSAGEPLNIEVRVVEASRPDPSLSRPPANVPVAKAHAQRAALGELQQRTARGAVYSVLNQAIRSGANLATVFVAAIYLSKAELGVFAIAFSIQSLLFILRDGGLPNALIQGRDLREVHFSSVFWSALGISTGLGVVLFAAAETIARYYGEPALTAILRVMSAAIVVQAFGLVQEANLRKQLDFGRIMAAESGATCIAALVTIILLTQGIGVWAMVLRIILAPILFALYAWFASPWRPHLVFSASAVRALSSFSFYFFLTTLLSYATTRIDSLIIGRLIGLSAAGLFFMARNFAFSILQDLATGVARVMFPAFSAIQDDLGALRAGFLTGTRCLAAVVFPCIAAMIVLSPAAIAVLLPREWSDAVVLIQIIAVQGVILSLNGLAAQVLLARGRTRLQFLYSVAITVAVIGAFYAGAPWGLIGITVTWTVARCLSTPLVVWLACREMQLTFGKTIRALIAPTGAALVAGLAAHAVARIWRGAGGSLGWGLLILQSVVGLAGYAMMARWLLPDVVQRLVDTLRSVARKAAAVPSATA